MQCNLKSGATNMQKKKNQKKKQKSKLCNERIPANPHKCVKVF